MITDWVKRWKDGRTESVSVSPDEIDLSSPSVSMQVEKIKRELGNKTFEMNNEGSGLLIPQLANYSGEFRAFDVKAYEGISGAHACLYLVYASSADLTPPFGLYFAKYDLVDNKFLVKDVCITDSDSKNRVVDETQKATVAIYQNGKIWVTYTEDSTDTAKGDILSCSSSDGGTTWGSFVVAFAQKEELSTVYQENSSAIKWKRKGSTWQRVAYPKASGGYMYRSSKTGESASFSTLKAKDVFLYTYTSTAKDSNGKTHVGKIKVYLDGKLVQTVDLASASLNQGWRTRIKLNKTQLSGKNHTIKLVHYSGNTFHIDAIRLVTRPSELWRLEDSIIRNTGVAQTALMCVSHVFGTAKKKFTKIYANTTGDPSKWGTSSISSPYYFTPSDAPYWSDKWTNRTTFYEPTAGRGLWMFSERQVNGKYVVKRYLFGGTTDYTGTYWIDMMTTNPCDSSSVRYTAGGSYDGGFNLTCRSTRVVNINKDITTLTKLSISPDPEWEGLEFESGASLPHTPIAVFSLPPSLPAESIGLFVISSKGAPAYYLVSNKTESVMLENITDYVTSCTITHDAADAAATMQITFLNSDNMLSSRDEFGRFYELLPTNYWDRHVRLVRLTCRFDQGSFYYETPLFLGALYGVEENYGQGDYQISLTGYDFGKWLQNFTTPYYYVYANPVIDWIDNASDYPLQILDGALVNTSLRAKNKISIPIDSNTDGATQDILVGWDLDNSLNPDNFVVDVNDRKIVQYGPGLAVSQIAGTGPQYATVTFVVNAHSLDTTNDKAYFGFAIASWDKGTHAVKTGLWLDFNFAAGTVSLYCNDSGSTSGAKKICSNIPFTPILGKQYHITAKANLKNISVTISSSGLSDVVLSGSRTNAFVIKTTTTKSGKKVTTTTYKDGRMLVIGSKSPGASISWINPSYRSVGSGVMKTDLATAHDIVTKAFQGIIPHKFDDSKSGDYFVSTVLGPEQAASDNLKNLAFQNNKRWYFDYDGTFRWECIEYGEPVYTLVDDDVASVKLTFDNQNFKNWIEVTTGSPSPTSRLSVADTTSILEDGIFFKQSDQSTLYTREQAQKIGIGQMYSNSEQMESVSITASRPLIFIKPRDVVRLSPSFLHFPGGPLSISKMYYVNSSSIQVDNSGISVSFDLISKARAQYSDIATTYNDGGVPY